MKRLFGLALVVMLGLPVGRAGAQTDSLSQASVDFFTGCMSQPGATTGECACVTGYFAGILQEDELRVMASILPVMNQDEDAVTEAIFDARDNLNLSDERFAEIIQMFSEMEAALADRGDRVCVPLAGK